MGGVCSAGVCLVVVGWACSAGAGSGVACSTGGWSASRTSMPLAAKSARFHVTCSPSSHLILTWVPLAQVMRPSTLSSVQRTRQPIFSVCMFVAGVVEAFFLRLMVYLPVGFCLGVGVATVALPRLTT